MALTLPYRQLTTRQIDILRLLQEGLDNQSIARRLKALAPLSRIVLITAYPDREFHRRGLEAGAVALLDKKDLDASALRQVIDDVM